MRDLDHKGIAQVLLGNSGDFFGHRRRAQHHLPLGGHALQNRLDVFGKAHAQHLVGFVEHGHAHVVEAQAAALQVVDHATGRTHHDLGRAAQGVELLADHLAAVDRHCAHAGHMLRKPLNRRSNLYGQLASGHQHQGLHAAIARPQLFEHGQGKRRRLTRTRLGAHDHIAATAQRRNGLRLHRRGCVKAQIGQGAGELGAKIQFGEAGHAGRRRGSARGGFGCHRVLCGE